MSPEHGIIGWDLGGAHLKAAVFGADGRLQQVVQLATPLWRGLDSLDAAVAALAERYPLARFEHRLTMTGELVDLFDDRTAGVAALSARAASLLPAGRLRLYAGPHGFVEPEAAERHSEWIASANWHATATWLSRRLAAGILVDVGSTTTDLLAFADGDVRNRGYSDRERLGYQELVYSGVVRTPVMAVVQSAPFAGDWVGIANEHFATMADVYRVLGWLPQDADLYPTADGRGKGTAESRRRLARMLGADVGEGDAETWYRVAAYVADRQLDAIALACTRLASLDVLPAAPLIGAGAGRFLVSRLARRLDRPYEDIDALFGSADNPGVAPASCAPALAVALLAVEESLGWT